MNLDDIPPLRGPRPEGAAKVRRRVPAPPRSGDLGRRAMVSGVLAAGGTLGLAALGVFPQARQAISGGFQLAGNYDVYPHCPSYAAGAGCTPGCGPSVVCADCCATSGSHRGYHKSTRVGKIQYRLRPNECYAGRYSGWLWSHSHRCGSCKKSVTWRCHDGWRRSGHGSYYRTICRWAVSCRS